MVIESTALHAPVLWFILVQLIQIPEKVQAVRHKDKRYLFRK